VKKNPEIEIEKRKRRPLEEETIAEKLDRFRTIATP